VKIVSNDENDYRTGTCVGQKVIVRTFHCNDDISLVDDFNLLAEIKVLERF